jgi:NAD+ diphosphatase
VDDDLLPEFAFRHAGHDRIAERRDDTAFLDAAWTDPSSRVVVIRDLELAVADDGTSLDRLAPADAPPGERMLLGRTEGAVQFLVIADGADGSDPLAERDFRPLRAVATALNPEQASLAVHAVALAQWHQRHASCAVCGARTVVVSSGAARRCPQCGAQHFPRTDPAVIMLVVDDADRCLLGHNAARDASWYSTLAGFVEPGESLEDAVVREVAEETGVHVDRVTYAGSQPWPFPSSLMVGFLAHASGTAIAVDGVEITNARWFTRDEIRREVEAGDLVIPSTISISGALVQSWYGAPLPQPRG